MEFVNKDLLQPVKGVTFVRHLFTALWQFSQYTDLNEVMIIMDFAENRKAMYNEERIKCSPCCFYLF